MTTPFRPARTRRLRTARTLSAAVATVLLVVPPITARATPTYTKTSSTCVITHDSDITAPGVSKIISSFQPPTSSTAVRWQMNSPVVSSPVSSTALGSIGSVTNPTTATFTLLSGTGVTQTDTSVNHGNFSSLKFVFTGIWNTGGSNFGPIASGYFSLGYGGTLVVGGTAKMSANITFLDGATEM